MPIRFKCNHCQKALKVEDALAGKRVACPACKKPVVVPVPTAAPADLEAFAAAALAEGDNKAKPKEEEKPKAAGTIDFMCPFCDAELHLSVELAGKKEPCPECKRIIRVPNPKEDRPKDWSTVASGPSAALANKPPELEGAWGSTTTRSKVSQQSLADAEAFPEEEVEPVGVGGWVKRATVVLGVGGLLFFVVSAIIHQRQKKQQKDSLSQALELVQGKERPKGKGRDKPELDLPPTWKAEVFRAAGEHFTRKREATKARSYFRKAYVQFPPDTDKVSPDDDLSLCRLAISLVQLGGGTEKEQINGERVDWKDLYKEISDTLQKIRSDDARAMAMRAVATHLLKNGQGPLAIGLAGLLNRPAGKNLGRSPVLGQKIALMFDQGQTTMLAKDFPLPAVKAGIDDANIRSGYAEGKARKQDWTGALEIVQAPGGSETARAQAALGVAELIFDNLKSAGGPAKAGPFITDALEQANELINSKAPIPPWLRFQLVRATARAGMIDNAREHVKATPRDKLSQELKNWCQLEILRGQMAKIASDAGPTPADDLFDKDSPARALAWEAWARHNTRLGYHSEVRDALEKVHDQRLKPFLLLGSALEN